MKKLAIFGASGHAKELLDLALDQGYSDICFLELNVQDNQKLMGFPVILESELYNFEHTDFAIGIAEPKIRKKIYELYPDLHYPNLVHSQASLGYGIFSEIEKWKGIIVGAGARITNSTQFNNFVIVSFNSTVGHDCLLGAFVSIMPGVNISGCVHFKTGVYVGTNAAVLPGCLNKSKVLGDYSVIGAGSVVSKDTLAHTTYIGAPAKEFKK